MVSGNDSTTEVLCIPVDDDRREKIQARHAIVLAFGSTISDFALTTDAQRVFQSMMGLPLIKTNLSAPLHISIEQPLNNEQRPFDPTDFAQGHGQLVLTGVRGEFLQQLAGWHDPCGHGGNGSQDDRPVLNDQLLSDLATDQSAQFFRSSRWVKEIQALGWQIGLVPI